MILERGWQLLMLDVTTSESLSGVSAGFCKSEPKWEGWRLLSYEVKWRGCGGDWMIWAGRGCLGGGCRSQKVRSGVGSRSFLEKGGREGRGGWRFKSAKLGWGERGGRLYVKVVYVPKRCSKKNMLSAGERGLRDENDAHYRPETDKHTRKQICKAQWKVKKPMYMLKKNKKKQQPRLIWKYTALSISQCFFPCSLKALTSSFYFIFFLNRKKN